MTDDTVEEKIERLKTLSIDNAIVLEQIRTLTKEIKDELNATGEVPEVPGVIIKFTSPKKVNVYWDAKGLEYYRRTHPDIDQFREEKWRKPALSMKIE